MSPTLRSLLFAYVVIVAVAASFTAYASVRLLRYRLDFVDGLRQRLYDALSAAEWKHLAALRRSDVLSTITVNVGWVSNGVFAFLRLCVTTVLSSPRCGHVAGLEPMSLGQA
jgi:ABC-type transport system involved in cytochrome bd biosynthesis fused ATPase/permease subunit